MNDSLAAIRQSVDSNEVLVTSHGSTVSTSLHRSFGKDRKMIPMWTKSDVQIRKLLQMVFPKLAHSARQRKSAARWLRIIYLYFRVGWTYRQIADELHVSRIIVRDVLRSIRRVVNGRSANGSGKRGRKRGRPNKIVLPVPGSFR